ncbi:MAG: alpha/beta hydrolase [candidate division Zixibacteria bacterium]|nr:alpha/beta hydrolase [candidate division Zixibacteria bacterium]
MTAARMVRLSTGIRMYGEQTGTGAPVLVFLHGGGGWLEHWRSQIDRFSKTMTVAACDLRGHGRTETPLGRYDISVFADDVAAWLETLGIERPVLVGHSLGGTIAVRFAFDYPDRVSGIVVVDSTCRTADLARDDWRRTVVARINDPETAKAQAARYTHSPESGHADTVDAMLAATPPPPPGVIHATHYGLLTHNNAAAASFVSCPTLIVGACDMDYWPLVQSFSDYIPHARVTGIPCCGHYVMIEQPKRFDEELSVFLDAVRLGTAPRGKSGEIPAGRWEG